MDLARAGAGLVDAYTVWGIIIKNAKLTRFTKAIQECLKITLPLYWATVRSLFSSAQSCLTLCDPMDCSMPGLPVHHQLPEFTQTHVGDAIQPSHPLSSPSPPALNISQHQGLFKWVKHSSDGHGIGVSASASVIPVNIQDWFPLGWTGWISLQSRDSQESSPTPQFKSINSSVLSFIYSPTLTSIHDSWKNHSFD